MGKIRTTNAHEWTRIAKEKSNHEKHEKHENNGIIQNHEWTRMNTNGKELFNHEKHERHENKKRGEEEPRMHTNGKRII